jgi:hypothetical protein
MLRFLTVAQAELDDAIVWYDNQAPGLGDAFLVEAVKALRLIERHPLAWHPLTANVRRCRLSRFPYGVIYAPDNADLVVVAVAHLHRASFYWRDRLKQ